MEIASRSIPPIYVLELGVRFHGDDQEALFSEVLRSIGLPMSAKKGCTVEG
jgi:hypothetical protein